MQRISPQATQAQDPTQLPELVEAPFDDLAAAVAARPPCIALAFSTTADGRGFSAAQRLRTEFGYKGEIIAVGPLIPDQLAMAFECGIDAVAVSDEFFARHGEQSWLTVPGFVGSSYQQNSRNRRSIWKARFAD